MSTAKWQNIAGSKNFFTSVLAATPQFFEVLGKSQKEPNFPKSAKSTLSLMFNYEILWTINSDSTHQD